ncbi:MAG: phage virion morphogenesis protein [Mariprofundus sp.]|nr:phage virion morphogenesis protein [Mariprofundus sp.]
MQTGNIKHVQDRLRGLELRGSNLKPLMAEIANLLQTTTEEAFDSESNPFDGAAWEPLAERTLAKKKGKPLYESGKMQDSLNVFSDNKQAIIGLPATAKGYNYPAVHQFGTTDGKVPARPFLPIDANGEISDGLHGDIMGLIEDFWIK